MANVLVHVAEELDLINPSRLFLPLIACNEYLRTPSLPAVTRIKDVKSY